MLQSKKVNIVIALVIAICLWMYVVGSIDPSITKKFTDIPVQLINEDSLTQEGLAVNSADLKKIDVSVKGDRTDISKISGEDIKVTADLYGRHKGSNYVSLEVQLPRGIELDGRSEDRVLVTIDDLVTAEKKVEVKLTGDVEQGMTLGKTKVSPDTLTVYGTKGNVEKVDHVEAYVNAKVLQAKATTHEASVSAVDKDGNAVDYITTSEKDVKVTASLEQYKKVKLNAKITGSVAEGYELEKVEIPETVEIEGPIDVLKGIDEVSADDIDISGLTENKRIKMNLDLPEGVSLKGGKDIYASVTVSGQDKKSFNFAGSDIKIEGLDDGFEAKITENTAVTVRGNQAAVSSIGKENIVLSVNLSGLKTGSHSVKVSAKVGNGISVSINPETVTVVITEK